MLRIERAAAEFGGGVRRRHVDLLRVNSALCLA